MTRQGLLATLIGLLLSGAVFASTPSEVVTWSEGVVYSYDGSGNIRQIGRDRFAYDVTSRLIQAEVNGIRRDYGYDAFGNRIDCTQARGTAEQSDCQQGRTISPGDNRIAGVPHDAAGNVQSLNQHLYAYDAVNMVTRDTAGVLSREFIYTADDERIATHETPTGSWHWTARDPSGKVLREFTSTDGGSWQWVKDYVYRDDKLVASRHPVGSFVETYHYHLDHLGTPRRITNALDATVGFHDYHAFGPEVPGGANEPSLTPLKYTGHERDRWLGEGDDTLDYMHARYYSPGMGRFLSVDPALDASRSIRQPQSWNRYSYGINNPVNRTDPDGRVDGNGMGEPLDWESGGLDRAQQLAVSNHTAEGTAILSSLFMPGPEDLPMALVAATRGYRVAARFIGRLFGGSDEVVEAYNRRSHYGRTPTPADRKALGAGADEVVDHQPPLVKRYYDGDPATGEKPGRKMTPEERRKSATDRSRMQRQPKKESCKQGAECAQYSKDKKKELGIP